MSEILDRLVAAMSDRYAIDRQLGYGGMATVYLARDLRHDREVAIKVLRPELAAVLGAERFLREIQIAAKLNHPHILPLYDSGQADSLLFYVMPYIEGESLRQRLDREKQLPIAEAVRLSTQAAAALEYAHRHGIIHRDIKPENILIHEGEALVADFGIALAVRAAGGERLTETGLSLGTPFYMSPEQATGERELDARSDVYSLGCVVYEMLAGTPPYTGPTAQAIVAKLLTERVPDVRALRETVPPQVQAAVTQAIAKLPADRFASAEEFARALGAPGGAVAAAPSRPLGEALRSVFTWARLKTALPWALLAVVTAAALWGWLRPAARPQLTRFALTVPPGEELVTAHARNTIALSPDGTRLAYVGRSERGRQLYVRDFDQLAARAIAGTEGASGPFFSPDGRWVGFWADGKLKKVALAGGPPLTIADAPQGRGATWGPNDVVLYSPNTNSGLLRVSAAGGVPESLTTPLTDSAETSHRWAHVLPHGKAVLFSTWQGGSAENSRIGVADLKTGAVKYLLDRATSPHYVATGHLVYISTDGSVLAVPFDAARLEVTGPPVSLMEGVMVKLGTAAAEFTISATGTLAYLAGDPIRARLVLVDRDGGERVVSDELNQPANPRFSPDGRRVALELVNQGHRDIWIYDLERRTLSRLTFEAENAYPEWTPDGRRVTFSSDRDGAQIRDLFWKPADGSGPDELLVSSEHEAWETAWAPDGKSLVYREVHPQTQRDLWIMPLGGDGKPRPYLTTSFQERMPTVSPDGRWLAYVSDESGRDEVYVRAFPEPGGRWQVSAEGGAQPRWAPNGRELLYRSGEEFISAAVRTQPIFEVGTRRVLFRGTYISNTNHAAYDVHPSGDSFVVLKSGAEQSELVVVLNWFRELEQRMGTAER